MGVHGLTTYLRENKRHLSVTFELPSKPLNAVVDGWSFLYELLYNSNIPWVYGGEQQIFCQLVQSVVDAWIQVGFSLTFVFDGPSPEVKFPTILSRLVKGRVQPSVLFFRTSPTSRAAPRYLSNPKLMPPLIFSAVIHTLKASNISVLFADGECDPFAVELASRTNAYVIGKDSDFVVLNAPGYLGYIPMDEMTWHAASTFDPSTTPSPDNDGFFEQVKKTKRKPVQDVKTTGKGIIPPENTSGLTLSLVVYNPSALASLLGIPTNLLPLIGALVGNDFTLKSSSTSRVPQTSLFERHSTPSERIKRVALTIKTILAGTTTQKHKTKYRVESVVDLIDRTVSSLVSSAPQPAGSGEIDAIVEKIVVSTLQYAIPQTDSALPLWPSESCIIHTTDRCPLLSTMSRKLTDEDFSPEQEQCLADISSKYLSAYRSGLLSPVIIDALHTGTFWPRLFLENPDLETVSSIGRTLRQWGYAVLDDALGLPEPSQNDVVETPPITESSHDGEDDDELVDVVESESDEEDSDLLTPIRGELRRLRDPSSLDISSTPRPPRIITEYVRRGTRVTNEDVTVPSLPVILNSLFSYDSSNTTPFILRSSENERLSIILRILRSDKPTISELPSHLLIACLTLRWVVSYFHDRFQEHPTKERDNGRWSLREARAFLAAFDWQGTMDQSPEPPVKDRNIQLTAQVLHTIASIDMLIQVFLMAQLLPSPSRLFSGKRFHSNLAGTSTTDRKLPNLLWEASILDLEGCFREERTVKVKKNKGRSSATTPSPQVKKPATVSSGLFGLLADMEA